RTICQASSASANPRVTLTRPRIDPSSVTVVSSLEIRYIMINTTRPCGMWWIMIGTVAAVHASVRRSVGPSRPGVGASSRRRNSKNEGGPAIVGERGPDALMGSASRPRASALADRHYGRGAEAKGLVGILHLEAHWEPCGKSHPVDGLLDARK